MMGRLFAIVVMTGIFSLGGCQSGGPKESWGTLIGAAAGGLVGSQIGSGTGQAAAIGLGVLLGGLAGQDVGRTLDQADMAYASQNSYTALESAPSGTTYEWHNPDSGNSGSTTPMQTYQTTNGTYCREFTQTVNVGGEIQDAYGTACRQPDGSWKISG